MIDEEFQLAEAEERLKAMRVSISGTSAAGIMGVIKAFKVHVVQMRKLGVDADVDEALANVNELIDAYVEVLTLAIRKAEAEMREVANERLC